jgi:hypothetical protein
MQHRQHLWQLLLVLQDELVACTSGFLMLQRLLVSACSPNAVPAVKATLKVLLWLV